MKGIPSLAVAADGRTGAELLVVGCFQGAPPDVELLPDDVSRHLADADIFCMASFSEGLPISIMEAMAVGVPVVTTWISGIPELAVHEQTAMTVPPASSEAPIAH